MNEATQVEFEEEISQILRTLRNRLNEYRNLFGGIYRGEIEDGLPVRMPAHLMNSCHAVADRVDILAALPKGGTVAEIGNFFGDFSVKIVELIQPIEFHTFDFNLDKIKLENRVILNNHGSVFFHEGDPSISIPKFPDRSFDLIYINKSKDYRGVWRELTESLRLLKLDGHIVCNDYTAWDPVQAKPYGVLPAVTNFAIQNDLEAVYISLHARGFLNIALRRMN